MHAILNVATMAAREAANLINRYAAQIDRIATVDKGDNQLVSEVDVMAEEAIIQTIRQHYPAHTIISEETAAETQADNSDNPDDYQWFIDPLDGTHNYLHGFPHYCVSIGVKRGDKLEHGVVLDPVRQELFTASRGSGAQLNGQRIRVSKTRRLSDALLCTGMPYRDPAEIKPWLRSYASVLPRAQSIHRVGSSALELAYVAAGRYDGLWQIGLKSWDMAAGVLLIQEAGGMLSDVAGKQDYMQQEQLVCGNAMIHEKLLQLVQSQIL